MKKASRIMFLVSGILSMVIASLCVIAGIVFVVLALPFVTDLVRKGIESGEIKTTAESVEAAILVWQSTCIGAAVGFLCSSVIIYLNGAFSFKARKDDSKKILITNIVFGFLSCIELNAVAGILGLIAKAIWGDKEDKVIENKE